MNKFLFFFSTVFILTSINSYAALYKGQKVYSKVCMQCHSDGEAFVATKKQSGWVALMNQKGKLLANLHLKSDKFKKEKKYKKNKAYFEGKSFKKKSKHLKQFLIEYAKDSGNVPACN